jgi:hypothetical protein
MNGFYVRKGTARLSFNSWEENIPWNLTCGSLQFIQAVFKEYVYQFW